MKFRINALKLSNIIACALNNNFNNRRQKTNAINSGHSPCQEVHCFSKVVTCMSIFHRKVFDIEAAINIRIDNISNYRRF